jgi:lipopolysaccharide kinase (Kdo/WaaP) family protein
MPKSAAAAREAVRAPEEGADRLERGRLGALSFEATAEGARLARALGEALSGDPPRVEGASLVKDNAVRAVYRLARERAYLKVHRTVGARALLPEFLRPNGARREWKTALAMRERGIPTGEPLALLEPSGTSPRRAAYLCREVPGARTAEEFFAGREEDRAAHLGRLAGFLARLHEAGFDPRDLHGGDLLVGSDGRCSIVDLHAVRGPWSVSRARRARGIALLRRGLRGVLREGEGEALLATYAEESRLADPAGFAREAAAAEASIERRWRRSRLRRCLEDRREFATGRDGGVRIVRRRDLGLEDISRALASHAAADPSRVVDRTPRGTSTLVAGTGGGTWIVKETRAGDALRPLADLFRGSRGRRAWMGAHLLGLLGLPTPRALALVEERRGPLVARSLLLREYLADASTLREFLAGPYGRLPAGEKRDLVRACARVVGSLHRARLHHRDLATKNLLVRRRDGTSEVLLIDTEDVRGRDLGDRERVAALAQLDDCPAVVSRPDRLRFLRAYEEAAGVALSPREVAEVSARSKARAARRATLR